MTKFGVMTSKRLRVTVVDVEGQNICLLGRNWIRALRIKTDEEDIQSTDKVHSVTSESMSTKFPLLFQDSLGRMNKFKTHIGQSDDVKP